MAQQEHISIAQSDQKHQARAEQRKLLAAYEAIQGLLPETPSSAWSAWIRLGRQAKIRLSILKQLWLWKRI